MSRGWKPERRLVLTDCIVHVACMLPAPVGTRADIIHADIVHGLPLMAVRYDSGGASSQAAGRAANIGKGPNPIFCGRPDLRPAGRSQYRLPGRAPGRLRLPPPRC